MALGRTLLIVNPAAKHGETERLIPVIEQLLQHVTHDTVVTQRMGHAAELAEGYGVAAEPFYDGPPSCSVRLDRADVWWGC